MDPHNDTFSHVDYIIIKFTSQEHKVSLQAIAGLITMYRIYIRTRRARISGLGTPLTSKAIFPHAYSRSGVGLVEISQHAPVTDKIYHLYYVNEARLKLQEDLY